MVVGTSHQRNSIENNEHILHVMAVQDFADANNLQIADDAQYERISKMYISEKTREGYQGCNKRLLAWLDSNHPQCVSSEAKSALQEIYSQRRNKNSTTPKDRNRAVQKKAFELIKEADRNNQPILVASLTVKIFVTFLFSMARNNTKTQTKFLSKSGCGSYRSALKDLYRQYGCLAVPEQFEAELSTKLKGL